MESRITRNQAALIAAAAILLILGGYFVFRNMTLTNQLEKEKIRSETLLSEKLNLDKTIEKNKKDLADLQGKNSQLDKIVRETSLKLDQKESEIRKLLAENASIADLRKKNSELEAIRRELENNIKGLNLSMEELLAESRQYNKELEALKSSNTVLSEHNAILEALLADNYRVEALRGRNEKLTVMARRTDKLMVSFELPSDVGDALSFRILTPGGEEISSADNVSASMTFQDVNKNFLASISGTAAGDKNATRAELKYEPESKLAKGIYRFSLYNGKDYLGSTQVRLK